MEAKKVIEHFQHDSLKQFAAHILAKNIPYYYSIDTSYLIYLQPLYDEHVAVSLKNNWERSTVWYTSIDSVRDKYYHILYNEKLRKYISDDYLLDSLWLVDHINLSFQTWEKNIFYDSCDFSIFSNYILPYKAVNRQIVTDRRKSFYEKHFDLFDKTKTDSISFSQLDTLLYYYQDIQHNNYAAMDIPIYSTETLEYIKRALCYDRCVFNVELLRSLGIPSAIDFIPCWGSMNSSHSWNTIIFNNEIYPFEPFWEEDKWKYKELYNNKTFDKNWGRFRLPKVYREVFEQELTSIHKNRKIDIADIPPLFRNRNIIDVSQQYFDTTNVYIKFSEKIPPKTYYSYLCVWNFGKWIPVQWSDIKKGTAIFKGMGREIIYLPAFYKNNVIIPAGDPVYITQKGEVIPIQADTTQHQDLFITNYHNGATFHVTNRQNFRLIENAFFTGSATPDFTEEELLCKIPDQVEMYNTVMPVNTSNKYRYLRLYLPTDTLAFNNLVINTLEAGTLNFNNSIFDLKENFSPSETKTEYINDESLSTGYKGHISNNFINIDLLEKHEILSIEYKPYLESNLQEDELYTLMYWENGWKEIEQQICKDQQLSFKNVPHAGLYILKNKEWEFENPHSRPFFYVKNEIIFK